MNLRPSGYEPDELPDCSTPQQKRNYEGCTEITQAITPTKLRFQLAKACWHHAMIGLHAMPSASRPSPVET